MIPQKSKVVINIGNHTKEIGIIYFISLIRFSPLWIHPVGAMRSISGDIQKEWFFLVFGDESHTFPKPHIRAIAIKFFKSSLPASGTDPFVGIIKIIISPVVRCLSNSTATMPYGILETTVLRPMRGIISQMPFASHAGLVAIFSKEVGQGFFGWVHHCPPGTGSISTGHSRMISTH